MISLSSSKIVDGLIRVGTVIGAIAGLFAFHETYIRPLYRVDLSGLWEVSNHIDASHDQRFTGLDLVFNILLVEDKSKLIGRGSKVRVAGNIVQDKERSLLELDGYTDGTNVFLFYRERAEQNPERVVHGVIVWRVTGRNAADGTFDSSVDGVSGSSRGRRIARDNMNSK
jgi:hypothetical protein